MYQPNTFESDEKCTEIGLMLPDTPIAKLVQLETVSEQDFAHASLICSQFHHICFDELQHQLQTCKVYVARNLLLDL